MCRGEETVYGDLLCFDDPILKQALDQLEGYQEYRAPELNDYNLKAIEAWSPSGQILAEVYAYLMDPQKITALGGQHLPDGNWPPQSQA